MAVRKISTSIQLDGEAEFKRQMSSVNSELKTLKTEMQYTEAAFQGQANTVEALTAKDKLLHQEVEQQEEKVKALEQAVRDSAEAFGETDRRTDGWRQSLNRAKTDLVKLNNELDDNTRYLEEAENSFDGTARSIDGFGKEAKSAEGQVGGLFEKMGDFNGKLEKLKGLLAGSAVIGGVQSLIGAITDLEESTREYRQIMGTLETSSAAAGYSADQTSEAYMRLYGVLGDTQTTATTLANLQAIGLGQQNLMTMIDQTTGAWATYGDSIPIDSLAESINETINAAKVTGTFADVLNWAGTSEDEFNAKLEATGNKTERANLVMQEMAKQGLSQTAEAWRENNQEIVGVNEAQAKWEEATGKLGETLAPAANALKSFGADAVGWVADKISNGIKEVQSFISWLQKMNDWLNKDSDARVQAGKAAQATRANGSHAAGLERVPYDGYLAQLHQDEAVLTAQEARVWRAFQDANISLSNPPAREAPAARQEEMETLQPVTIPVTVELDKRIVGEAVTEYQIRTRKARGR